MASAVLLLRRLPGVDRPALAVQMTTAKGPFVLLDIGANTDSTGLNLAQYARWGRSTGARPRGGQADRGPPLDRRGGRQG